MRIENFFRPRSIDLKQQETLRNNMIQFVVSDLNRQIINIYRNQNNILASLTGSAHLEDRRN